MDSIDLPLSGIRVLELASVWAMPGAAMYLADQGADVVKVEPLEGDIGRTVTMSPPIGGLSRAFWSLNRNKRGIVVDLKHREGAALARQLARTADVLIHNFRPGVDARLGLSYETLCAENRGLIYVAYNAFGPAGPRRNARGYDLLVQAASGIAMRRTDQDGSPQPVGIFAVDMASSMMAGYAIMLALFQRERTGQGKKIEGSLLQTAFALQVPDAVRVAGIEEPPLDASAPRPAVYSQYRCGDGGFIQLSVASNSEWQSLCKAIARDDLATDPDLAQGAQRVARSGELRAVLESVFASRPAAHWQREFDDNDVPAGAVETPESVFESEQARANDCFVEVEQPGIGTATIVGIPFAQSDVPQRSFTPAPALGQHTDEVLAELGLSQARISALRRANAIA